MIELQRAALRQVCFFYGRLLTIEIDQLNTSFSNFVLKNQVRARKRVWVQSLVQRLPDWSSYDLYHKKFQKKKMKQLVAQEPLDMLVESPRNLLFYDPPERISHKNELKEKAFDFF